jgi:hypothetical protein
MQHNLILASESAYLHLSCIWLVQSGQERRARDYLGDDTKIITEEERAEGREQTDKPLERCKQTDLTSHNIYTGSDTDL